MSSNPLDLGFGSTQTAINPLTLQPPQAPPEVEILEPEKVGGFVMVDVEEQKKHSDTADAFLDQLLEQPMHSPQFATMLTQLTKLGEGTMQHASKSTNRMLQRPAATLAAKGDDPASRTGRTLTELRLIVTELDPKRHDLTGVKRVLKFLPGGSGIQRYFLKYESSQAQLDAITKTLKGGQDELRQDNAAIQTERDGLWAAMGQLANYAVLALMMLLSRQR